MVYMILIYEFIPSQIRESRIPAYPWLWNQPVSPCIYYIKLKRRLECGRSSTDFLFWLNDLFTSACQMSIRSILLNCFSVCNVQVVSSCLHINTKDEDVILHHPSPLHTPYRPILYIHTVCRTTFFVLIQIHHLLWVKITVTDNNGGVESRQNVVVFVYMGFRLSWTTVGEKVMMVSP